MAFKDVAGRARPGMFEQIHDEDSGLTFTPTGGTGRKTTFKVTGGGPNTKDTIRSTSARARHLAYEAREDDKLFWAY